MPLFELLKGLECRLPGLENALQEPRLAARSVPVFTQLGEQRRFLFTQLGETVGEGNKWASFGSLFGSRGPSYSCFFAPGSIFFWPGALFHPNG